MSEETDLKRFGSPGGPRWVSLLGLLSPIKAFLFLSPSRVAFMDLFLPVAAFVPQDKVTNLSRFLITLLRS